MVGGRKWPPPPPPPSPCGRRGRVAFLRVRNRERLQTQDKAQQCCMARFLSVSQSARVCVCVSVCDAFPVGWLCIQSADGRPPGHPLLGGQCAWPQLPVVLYVIATAVSHPARYVCSTVRWTLFPITLPLARVQSLLPSACLYVGNMPNGSEPQNQRVQTPQKILCTCYLWPWSFLFWHQCSTLCTSGFADDIMFHVMWQRSKYRWLNNSNKSLLLEANSVPWMMS